MEGDGKGAVFWEGCRSMKHIHTPCEYSEIFGDIWTSANGKAINFLYKGGEKKTMMGVQWQHLTWCCQREI